MVQNLLESNLDEYLAFTKDKNTWTHSQYDRKAIELSIYADTILIDADVIFTNLKRFSMISSGLRLNVLILTKLSYLS